MPDVSSLKAQALFYSLTFEVKTELLRAFVVVILFFAEKEIEACLGLLTLTLQSHGKWIAGRPHLLQRNPDMMGGDVTNGQSKSSKKLSLLLHLISSFL